MQLFADFPLIEVINVAGSIPNVPGPGGVPFHHEPNPLTASIYRNAKTRGLALHTLLKKPWGMWPGTGHSSGSSFAFDAALYAAQSAPQLLTNWVSNISGLVRDQIIRLPGVYIGSPNPAIYYRTSRIEKSLQPLLDLAAKSGVAPFAVFDAAGTNLDEPTINIILRYLDRHRIPVIVEPLMPVSTPAALYRGMYAIDRFLVRDNPAFIQSPHDTVWSFAGPGSYIAPTYSAQGQHFSELIEQGYTVAWSSAPNANPLSHPGSSHESSSADMLLTLRDWYKLNQPRLLKKGYLQ